MMFSMNMNQQDSLLSYFPEDNKSRIFALVGILTLVYCAYWTGVIIYRLTLHPLARFPGPFLCRIGYFQQIYFEAVLNGKFLERLPDLHKKYGPVVRINPHEVHINDPEVFHTIYRQNSPFTKDPVAYTLGVPNALSMTIPIDLHRQKRQTLDPCFSKRRINLLEGMMYEEVERLLNKIADYGKRDELVPIQELYYCYTDKGDVISRYLFGKSLDLIEMPDFMERVEQMRTFTRGIWVAIHFGFIRVILTSIPRWLAAMMDDAWPKVVWFCETLAKEAIQDHKKSSVAKPLSEETIFDRLLDDDSRRKEKGKENSKPLSFQDLADESVALLLAGTETTATMTAYGTYFFERYPETQQKIMDEINSVERDENGRLPLSKLEALPYFSGFVRETLRYAHGIPGRLTRTVPKGGLYVPSIKDTIPEGYVVGMSHIFIHNNPDIFEAPHEFKPERWMGDKGKELNHWLLSFSKGRTDCIGKNLAMAEMHLLLANLFARFTIELGPNSDDNMVWLDRAIVHPKGNLRIKVRPKFQIKGIVNSSAE